MKTNMSNNLDPYNNNVLMLATKNQTETIMLQEHKCVTFEIIEQH